MAITYATLIEFTAKYHGETQIVSRTVEGPIHRYGYHNAYARIGQLANALNQLGIQRDERSEP